MMEEDYHANDLPLFANSNEIQVQQYFFDYYCDPGSKMLKGSVYLLLQACKQHKFHIKSQDVEHLKNSDSQTDKKGEILKVSSESIDHTEKSEDFILKLDSRDIVYHRAEELINGETFVVQTKEINSFSLEVLKKLQGCDTNELLFSKEPWCLKIWKPGILKAEHFPKLVKITYETVPSGASLRWATDQDGK